MTTGVMHTDTVLDRILAQTGMDIAARKKQVPEADLLRLIGELDQRPLSLATALRRDYVAVIAEVKRGSPSRGVFPVEVDPRTVAMDYKNGGAAAISCLTNGPFFYGSRRDLEIVADVAHLGRNPIPVIRKDFIVDPYQLLEAKSWGADAVLLIVAALSDELLSDLYHGAQHLGLSVLVEVHNESETERALRLSPPLLGVNNRNLKTFDVDLKVTRRISLLVPDHTLLVSESGIFTNDDVSLVAGWGAASVLVGESLIVQDNREHAVRSLSGVARTYRPRTGDQ